MNYSTWHWQVARMFWNEFGVGGGKCALGDCVENHVPGLVEDGRVQRQNLWATQMDFLNLYGFDKLAFLLKVEESGLIKPQEKDGAKFKDHLVKTLKLTEKSQNIFNPTCPSYVFDSTWNPITTRLVHEAISGTHSYKTCL